MKVKRGTSGTKRVRVSFTEKEAGPGHFGYASFSLPPKGAKQLAYAILTACVSDDVKPIEFSVAESTGDKAAAA